MKTLLKRCAGYTADAVGLIRRHQGNQALILMLHRVLPHAQYEQLEFQKMLAVSEPGLLQLIGHLQQQYTLIQLDDYLALSTHERDSDRFACLTFDDGWQDNFHFALPILQACNAPASIYLSTGFIGTEKHFWWQAIGDVLALVRHNNRLHDVVSRILQQSVPSTCPQMQADDVINALKRCRPDARNACIEAIIGLLDDYPAHGMTWEQVQSMSDTGLIRFGTHTVSHCLLTQLDSQSAEHEMTACREELLSRPTIRSNDILCYPNGDFNQQIAAQADTIGYRAALGTHAGYASLAAAERYSLPRINVTEATAMSPALFNYRLSKIGYRAGTQR